MATPSEKLAHSLERLQTLQKKKGAIAIRSTDLQRTDKERLLKNGFLQEVMKGWYIPSRPDERKGDSTAWYASFWQFCAIYLTERFGEDWCLSPEQSLAIHSGNWTVPKQLLVRAPKAGNKVLNLPHRTSLLDVRASLPSSQDRVEKEGLRVFSIEASLIACHPGFFKESPTDASSVLSLVKDPSDLLSRLLEGGHSSIAGRLAGAFRRIGSGAIADDIVKTMEAAQYEIREQNPFEPSSAIELLKRDISPYVNRVRALWQTMREPIIQHFPEAPGRPRALKKYLKDVKDAYATDAYHSLSIEGYEVSAELIERVRSGKWNSSEDDQDRDHRNALAARGYWQAFQAVLTSTEQVLKGSNPGEIAEADHRSWYREMFASSVVAGLLQPTDLAGYRRYPVYIRQSTHVPMNRDAVRDVMPIFFELLAEEKHPSVRVVLGHFIFVYIHPYPDGNGRIGRFLMNLMLAAGGYPWTVVPLRKRNDYMEALEIASTKHDITPFTKFLGGLVEDLMEGNRLPEIEK